MAKEISVKETSIPGFYEIELVVNGDNRGWFKENYHKAKMEALGLPKFEVIQNNFSFNAEAGATRGLHAEPWEKFISVANGRVFGAWVDLRQGESYGRILTMEISPEKAVYVPRGVANGYQTLEPNITYTYLVNAHWSPEVKYIAVNAFDPDLKIKWPYNKKRAILSEKDLANPLFKDAKPVEF